jgi:hypothetical protein
MDFGLGQLFIRRLWSVGIVDDREDCSGLAGRRGDLNDTAIVGARALHSGLPRRLQTAAHAMR